MRVQHHKHCIEPLLDTLSDQDSRLLCSWDESNTYLPYILLKQKNNPFSLFVLILFILEILRRYAPQDEQSGSSKNTPTAQLFSALKKPSVPTNEGQYK